MRKELYNCLAPRSHKGFRKLGDNIKNPTGDLIHIDRGAQILGVGHLDCVKYERPKQYGDIVTCPQLDDRLGVWCLLDLLPRMGLNFDVLLTDCEEVGQSTAEHFKTSKHYRWIFEFDRRGTDVVMYDYETSEYRQLLRDFDFSVGNGSFSDICSLDHLGATGFNFGTGYHNEHTSECFADLRDTMSQACRFATFFKANELVDMPYCPVPRYRSSGGASCRPGGKYNSNGWSWAPGAKYGEADDDLRGSGFPEGYGRNWSEIDWNHVEKQDDQELTVEPEGADWTEPDEAAGDQSFRDIPSIRQLERETCKKRHNGNGKGWRREMLTVTAGKPI